MGAARTLLIVIGAVLSILGTYAFAIVLFFPGVTGSGLGFAMNLLDIFAIDPTSLGADPIIWYLMLTLFILWLVAGVLQLIGLKSRIVGIIFSLVPLAMGIMFLLLFYTEILGPMTAIFTFMTIGEQFGDIFPVFVDLGGGVGLGAFFLVGGGALGLIGSILPKD
ncbi:MAG: hypothetical protein ACFE96_05640 [Candidatus Hermodarchaeota archaeon]